MKCTQKAEKCHDITRKNWVACYVPLAIGWGLQLFQQKNHHKSRKGNSQNMLWLHQQAWTSSTLCKIPFYLMLKNTAFMCMKDYYKKGIPRDSNVIWGKSKVNIWQSKKKLKNLKLENLMSAKDVLIILERWFGFKSVKITEAAPASQEAAHKFQMPLRISVRRKNICLNRSFM